MQCLHSASSIDAKRSEMLLGYRVLSRSADTIRRNAGAATLFEARVFKDLCFAAAAISKAPLP
jgi:hypothetical protein